MPRTKKPPIEGVHCPRCRKTLDHHVHDCWREQEYIVRVRKCACGFKFYTKESVTPSNTLIRRSR